MTFFSWIFIFPWSRNIVESSKIIEASLSVSIITDTSHGGCPRLFVNLPKGSRIPLSPALKVLRTSCCISLRILAVTWHFLHFSTKRRGHLYKTEDAPEFFFLWSEVLLLILLFQTMPQLTRLKMCDRFATTVNVQDNFLSQISSFIWNTTILKSIHDFPKTPILQWCRPKKPFYVKLNYPFISPYFFMLIRI